MMKINISIQNEYVGELENDEKLNLTILRKNTRKIVNYLLKQQEIIERASLKDFDYSILSFEILFVNDNEIQEINRNYRQKDKPTDVITFALFADSEPKFVLDGEISLGEIIISIDTIKKQAKNNGFNFLHELYYIISHGILHLLGFDHLTESEYQFMVEYQNKSLELKSL